MDGVTKYWFLTPETFRGEAREKKIRDKYQRKHHIVGNMPGDCSFIQCHTATNRFVHNKSRRQRNMYTPETFFTLFLNMNFTFYAKYMYLRLIDRHAGLSYSVRRSDHVIDTDKSPSFQHTHVAAFTPYIRSTSAFFSYVHNSTVY